MQTTPEPSTSDLRDLLDVWAQAEQAADTAALEALSDPGFRLGGPAGFVLDRSQWLRRFDDLDVESLELSDVAPQVYAGRTGVVLSVMTQRATYAGRRADGTFRVAHTAVLGDEGWRLAHQQISPLAGPPQGAS